MTIASQVSVAGAPAPSATVSEVGMRYGRWAMPQAMTADATTPTAVTRAQLPGVRRSSQALAIVVAPATTTKTSPTPWVSPCHT